MKRVHFLTATVVVLCASAQAQSAPSGSASHHPAATASASADPTTTEGEVRKVDKEQGKVTLKHGPIDSLGMPAMTMVYKAADPKMLASLKPGDRVRFAIEENNGALTLTAIDLMK